MRASTPRCSASGSRSTRRPDGERVTIVTFADLVSERAWRDHPEHLVAQRQGIADFYSDYSIQVATVFHDHVHRHEG